jgi:hypothetical protein
MNKKESKERSVSYFFMKTDTEIQDWADENLPESIPGFCRIGNGGDCRNEDIFVSVEIEGKRYGKWFRPVEEKVRDCEICKLWTTNLSFVCREGEQYEEVVCDRCKRELDDWGYAVVCSQCGNYCRLVRDNEYSDDESFVCTVCGILW